MQVPWAQHNQHAHSGWSVCRGCRCRGPVQVNYEAAKIITYLKFNIPLCGVRFWTSETIFIWCCVKPGSWSKTMCVCFKILTSKWMAPWFLLKPATWFQAQNDGGILLPVTECLVLDETLMGAHYPDRRDISSCSQGASSVSQKDGASPYQYESASTDSNGLFPYLIVWKMSLWLN